jgi:hypothetical protein
VESHHDLIPLFEHDLFGKPVSTFPDHALTPGMLAEGEMACIDADQSTLGDRWRHLVTLGPDESRKVFPRYLTENGA